MASLLIRPPADTPAHEHDEARACARIIGEEATSLYPGEPWASVEPHMADEWKLAGRGAGLAWSQVRGAAHAAWQAASLARACLQRDDAPVVIRPS